MNPMKCPTLTIIEEHPTGPFGRVPEVLRLHPSVVMYDSTVSLHAGPLRRPLTSLRARSWNFDKRKTIVRVNKIVFCLFLSRLNSADRHSWT